MALIATLIATASFAIVGAGTAFAAPSTAPCTQASVPGNNPLPTKWTDQGRPPTTVKVKRSSGPAAGKVQTVSFWQYVGTVLRTEYSGGIFPPAALRAGALSVKQYAWYYAIQWRGGKVPVYQTDPVTGEQTIAGYDCYDLSDTTVDQIYKPEKLVNGVWQVGNYPGPPYLEAMAATWHISLRKDFNNKPGDPNRIFLSGYRSGTKVPCGYEDITFRLYQKSVKDCGTKGMTTEEIWRIYYGSNLYIVDARDHDMIVSDWDGDWRGDVGVINNNDWNLFAGGASGFTNAANGALGAGTVIDAAVGDVTGVDVPPPDPTTGTPTNPYRKPRPASNVADLVTLVSGSPPKVVIYRSNGATLNKVSEFDAPDATRLLVADFTGDMNADVGLLRSGPGGAWTLKVHRNVGGAVSSTGEEWWSGPLDLSASAVTAGDVNTDGKADLVITDGNQFRVAKSPPSCLNLTTIGACTSVPAFKLGDAETWLNGQGWDTVGPDTTARVVMGDWNRDGRDDAMALVKEGNGVKVVVLKAMADNSFASAGQQWANGTISFDSVRPVAFHGNLDGFADLALVQNTGSVSNPNDFWLSTVATGLPQIPGGMTAVGLGTPSVGQTWPATALAF